MGGSEGYQIKPCPKFESSYSRLLKAHYRKDAKSRAKFEKLVDQFLKELKENPCPDDARSEPFPSHTSEEGFDLRKKRWKNLPGLQGAARYGRLLYLVHHPTRTVCPFWIYTHEEFGEPKSRPPDREIEREISSIKEIVKEENDADKVSVISLSADTLEN